MGIRPHRETSQRDQEVLLHSVSMVTLAFPFSFFGNLSPDLCAILRFKFGFQDQRTNIFFFLGIIFPLLYFVVVLSKGVLSILDKNGKICPCWYCVFSLSPQTEVVNLY